MSSTIQVPTGERTNLEQQVLTPAAIEFLQQLHRRFESTRQALLQARRKRQEHLDRGEQPDFLESTREIREREWRVAPIPADLLDRRVEITGPTDRKMLINALNSGANVYMADFEDSNAPTWSNCLEGQQNLRDAVAGTIEFVSPEGKEYRIKPNPAVLFVRPRGWHLNEKHFKVDGTAISASLFDFGLFFFHNASALVKKGTGPYFYLPKMEAHPEARLWNDVFVFAQEYVGLPKGTIRATVLIETITAAFEMDEILYELRDHSAGLNCGRWDYIFSFIKKFRNHADHVLPDRSVVTMEQPFLRSYVELLIHTCHRRGIHAMGGMAAQIPIRNNPRGERRGDGTRSPGQASRSSRRARWHVGRASGIGADSTRNLRRVHEDAEPDSRSEGSAVANHRRQSARNPAWRHHRERTAPEHRRCSPISAGVVGRIRVRPDLRFDGRRRHGGNLSRANLAVASLRRALRRWPHRLRTIFSSEC